MKQTKLIKLRKKYGYSQLQMAKKLHITQSYYSQLEQGKRKLSYPLIIDIAKIFFKTPDEIFYPKND